MKRFFLFLAAFFMAAMLAAQTYEPTTTWPYVYSDFQTGELVMLNGQKHQGLYNVHLAEGRLHFLEKDIINEVLPVQIFSVRIGADIYTVVNGQLMKVVARNEKGLVAEETRIDFVKLNATGGAYGSSSNSISTQSLSSFEGMGGGVGTNHMELKASKSEGEVLPLLKKLYLVSSGKTVYATRRDVESEFQPDKKAFRKYCKDNSIRWKSPESLLKVIDYFVK